jgi:predicted transcriptional regulator
MNVNVLIDSIVRQTTVLIAQLATAAGTRAPLAHVANQVFVELVAELRQQGLGNKVIADMFGLALRTYHARVRRLSESATERGRSLWEAVHDHVRRHGTVLRADVLARFVNDDESTVRGVLHDLVDSGILFRSGRGDATSYRAAGPEDQVATHGAEGHPLDHLVWVMVSQRGTLTRDELSRQVTADASSLQASLDRLLSDGRIGLADGASPTGPRYRAERCVIPLGSSEGWEASVWDHFQAMVTAIGSKLERGERTARLSDAVGGSTYTFDVWPGHPHREEVLSFLQRAREQGVALREKVERYNQSDPGPGPGERVIAYVGQTVTCDLEANGDGERREETP